MAGLRYIIIDDDKLNNKICSTLIVKLFSDAHVTAFTEAQAGFDFIKNEYGNSAITGSTTLFLDIKMPVMDAWGFLEVFEKLDDVIKKKIRIYILSSSIDKRDMERAQAHPDVEYYLIKPLTKESISLITHMQKKKEEKK
ncbi:MAG: response regulator [Chitinophagia bacterium]|nr:response regulator [Chitinophagia bacterium]